MTGFGTPTETFGQSPRRPPALELASSGSVRISRRCNPTHDIGRTRQGGSEAKRDPPNASGTEPASGGSRFASALRCD